MNQTDWIVLICLLVMNLIAVLVTIHDKRAARRFKWRVPERVLWILALLSTGTGMYITMRTIHHKTKHRQFMIGIPIIMIVETLLLACGLVILHTGSLPLWKAG